MIDESDWQNWFEKHGAALLLLARQFAANPADAEDIVQEAFVRFWRTRVTADDPAAYLFVCVKNRALDWRTSERRLKNRELAVSGEAQTSFFEHDAERGERLAEMEAALRELPENQREVLVMKIWGELTFPQIAQALEIPQNTAASRYRYALEALRGRLAKEGVR